MENAYEMKEYYTLYLKNIIKVSNSSIKHYMDALNSASKWLKDKKLIDNHIFEVTDIEQLLNLREILYSDEDFMALNQRGHHMYSSGLNHYCEFAQGHGFDAMQSQISVMDIPLEPKSVKRSAVVQYNRSSILRQQTIETANYMCELDHSHQSFVAESNNRPYMEGHHAIPINKQGNFAHSLDVYANIICLCPVCHRRIHYGLKEDRIQMMNQIYVLRQERLKNAGIIISKDEFAQSAL